MQVELKHLSFLQQEQLQPFVFFIPQNNTEDNSNEEICFERKIGSFLYFFFWSFEIVVVLVTYLIH